MRFLLAFSPARRHDGRVVVAAARWRSARAASSVERTGTEAIDLLLPMRNASAECRPESMDRAPRPRSKEGLLVDDSSKGA